MRLVPFRPEHLAAIELQPLEAREHSLASPEVRALADTMLPHTIGYAGLDGRRVVACGGAIVFEGVAHCWFRGSPLVRRHRHTVALASQAVLRAILRQVCRAETSVPADHRVSRRWLGWLGFEEVEQVEMFGLPYIRCVCNGA